MEVFYNNYDQVYNATEDETLTSRIESVICILMQRAIYIAGFDNDKELLTIHYTGYGYTKPVWDLDFFEPLFGNGLLLTMRDKIKTVFISTDKNLVVPEELYKEETAKKWLGYIHYVEEQDIVTSHSLANDKAQYVLAAPTNITELVKINLKKAAILPLPLYHFKSPNKQSLYLQCCISNEQVCATLHNYSQLLWHKIFNYTCAEDIAYEVKHLCMENNISPSKISIACNAMSAAEYDMINDLSQYYQGIKAGDGSPIVERWDPAISLAKQLLACV